MITRRQVIAAALTAPAVRHRRKRRNWPMGWQSDVFPLVIVEGSTGGVFVYDSAGNLIASMAAMAGIDPLTHSNEPGNAAYGIVSGDTYAALLNSPTPTIVGAIAALSFIDQTNPPFIAPTFGGFGNPGFGTEAVMSSGIGTLGGQQSGIVVADSQRAGIPGGQILLDAGQVQITPTAGGAVSGFDLEGATAGAGQLAFIKNSPTVNGDHTLTVNHTGTGTDNTVALNVTSNSDDSSSMYISGQNLQRGVLKISHNPGSATGLDANASLIALDTGSTVGTACQGIAMINTTPTTGNLVLIRNTNPGTTDDFVIKATGHAAIGVALGHTPTGMLEIQQDASAVGLAMTAFAGGTGDMIQLKDSGGGLRFQVSNSGNMTARATAFLLNPVVFGSASSGVGGGGGCTLQIVHNTDPTSNPPAGSILLYCDSTGHLTARGSAGTITVLAGP